VLPKYAVRQVQQAHRGRRAWMICGDRRARRQAGWLQMP
jgi:ribosomal protein L44E